MPNGSTSATPMMHSAIRWAVCAVGAALVVVATTLAYNPPQNSTTQYDHKQRVLKREVKEVPPSSLSVALLGGGVLLILFGANGLLLLRVSGPGFVAETHSLEDLAKGFYRSRPDLLAKATEDTQSGDQGEPADDASTNQKAAAIIEQNGVIVKVYDLQSVPSNILAHAILNWPDNSRPQTVGDFEFASKPVGKGNRPWTVQFSGLKPVIVTYGGRGNNHGAPTVRFTDN